MTEHGTRTRYQAGCDCTPCRVANAAYEADYRRRVRLGLPLLGRRVSAVKVRRLLRLLVQQEGYTPTQLAADLGWHGNYARFYHARRVTMRIAVRVRRFYRVRVVDEATPDALPFEDTAAS